MIAFSVVICTHNRAAYLADAIGSVQAQDYPSEAFEIIVVDNASTDDTRQAVERLQQNDDQSVRYIYEPRLGLSHARNAGAAAAQGDVVAYIDDDAVADADWLSELAQVYLSDSDEVACVAGMVELVWEKGKRPSWLPVEMEVYFASSSHLGQQVHELSPGSYPVGCNLSIRSDTLERVGYFSTPLGRKGVQLLSNEEVEVCHRIWAIGAKIIYTPKALVLHRVPACRTTKLYLLKRSYWQGISDAILEQHLAPCSRAMLGKEVLAGVRDTMRDASSLLPAMIQGDAHCRYLLVFRIASRLGRAQQKMRFLLSTTLTVT